MAEKKAETSSQEASAQPVVDLLTQILSEFRKQAQSTAPPPLNGEAVKAVEAFKEISSALNVKKS